MPSCQQYIWGIPRQIYQAETLIIFFPFKYVIDGHKNMTYSNFHIFLKISLAVMIEVVDLALRAVIDSLEIYSVNFLLIKKFEFRNLFHFVQNFISGSIIIFNKMFSFKHDPLFEIFTFAMFFKGVMTRVYSSSPNLQNSI